MALPQKVLLSIAVVIICGSSVLALPTRVATSHSRPITDTYSQEPLPLPCQKQHWTNADPGMSYVDRTAEWNASGDRRGQQGLKATSQLMFPVRFSGKKSS